MNQEFLDRLEQWNEEDKYQEIIDAIEALPEEALNFTLTSALARAYNNLAMDLMPPEDRPLYQRALDLLLPLEDRLEEAVKEDPEKARKYAELLYSQALLIAGLPLEDPSAYTDLVCELMK